MEASLNITLMKLIFTIGLDSGMLTPDHPTPEGANLKNLGGGLIDIQVLFQMSSSA